MRDRILGTSFDAEPTEDATVVIDVVNLRIAFINTYAFFGRAWIVGRLNVNTLGRARGGAEKTSDALLPA